jgi:hypothetical protein
MRKDELDRRICFKYNRNFGWLSRSLVASQMRRMVHAPDSYIQPVRREDK